MVDKEIAQEIEESGEGPAYRTHVLMSQNNDYDIKGQFKTDIDNPRTTLELVAHLEKHEDVEIDARVIHTSRKKEERGMVRMDRKQFLESWHKAPANLREGNVDYFGTDTFPWGNNIVGSPDYIPLLGGPFYKQQYYMDYIRGHQQAFYAYHHDPIANAAILINRDFTLGRDWKVTCDNDGAMALWEAFCEVNNFREMMDSVAIELGIYGEEMIWWLPNNETKISYQDRPGQLPPKGAIPRVRLIDPSCIWEIVTYPEDITRVLWYQWVAPTQYQIYTGKDKGGVVPTSKFIFQQIPADQVDHYKVNSVSNEKRGRSDLYPVLDYLKRLRDSVQYSIIAMQKQSAWSIDTAIDGSPAEIDAYVAEQQAIGSIPPAGSEFVHSKKVERNYLANEGGARGGTSPAFEWCLSMIAAGTGIPVQYFGTHLSGASTRASALVATEPVAKKFEMRQQVYRTIIERTARRLFKMFGIESEINVTFPEIVVQDRTAKLRDLLTAEQQGWISTETAANIAAKELQIHDYVYDEEKKKIDNEMADAMPLTLPGQAPLDDEADPETTGISSGDRRALSMNNEL